MASLLFEIKKGVAEQATVCTTFFFFSSSLQYFGQSAVAFRSSYNLLAGILSSVVRTKPQCCQT